jgi:hypothetical protein
MQKYILIFIGAFLASLWFSYFILDCPRGFIIIPITFTSILIIPIISDLMDFWGI